MKGSGFTLLEIMIVVTLVGLLCAIAIPSYVRSREYSQLNACINNLRQIDGAKSRYALENGKVAGDPVTTPDIMPYFIKKWQECPAGGTYSVNPVAEDPECSTSPTHTF